MESRSIIKIKESDIGQWKLPPDGQQVIIEITERTEDKKTKGGLMVGHNADDVYAEGDSSHKADVAEVWGTIMAVPTDLHYHRSRLDTPWDTDVEVQIGDTVWFDYFGSVNCTVLMAGERMFYMISYYDLYVAKRGDTIIPLNGYCLCEPLEVDNPSKFAINIGDDHRKDRTRVKYLGKPNKSYLKNDRDYGTYNNDKIDVKSGDIVILRKDCPLYYLERVDMIATFSDSPYYVIQRRRFEMVVNK